MVAAGGHLVNRSWGGNCCEVVGVGPGVRVADVCWLARCGTSDRMAGGLGMVCEGGFGSRIWYKYSGASDDRGGPGRSSLLQGRALSFLSNHTHHGLG